METTTAPQGAILEHANEHPNFNSVNRGFQIWRRLKGSQKLLGKDQLQSKSNLQAVIN